MVDVTREALPRSITPAPAAQLPAGGQVAAARSTLRVPAIPTVPPHVATMLGLSVAGYGVALALVTGLQAMSDASTRAARAPLAATIDRIATSHDALERTLADAADAYAAAAGGYDAVASGMTAIDQRLAALATSVKRVDGASRALPASVALPPVVRSVRTSPTKTSHATSGGSAAP